MDIVYGMCTSISSPAHSAIVQLKVVRTYDRLQRWHLGTEDAACLGSCRGSYYPVHLTGFGVSYGNSLW
eukprot:1920179-Pleurochrysis_carterae.AAC.1